MLEMKLKISGRAFLRTPLKFPCSTTPCSNLLFSWYLGLKKWTGLFWDHFSLYRQFWLYIHVSRITYLVSHQNLLSKSGPSTIFHVFIISYHNSSYHNLMLLHMMFLHHYLKTNQYCYSILVVGFWQL